MNLPALPPPLGAIEATATEEKCIFHAVVIGHSRQQIINQVGVIMRAWGVADYRMVVGTVVPHPSGEIGPPQNPPPEKGEPRQFKAVVDVFAFTTDTPTPPAP